MYKHAILLIILTVSMNDKLSHFNDLINSHNGLTYCYSYQCGLQEAKGREKKESIDTKLLELNSALTGLKGMCHFIS